MRQKTLKGKRLGNGGSVFCLRFFRYLSGRFFKADRERKTVNPGYD